MESNIYLVVDIHLLLMQLGLTFNVPLLNILCEGFPLGKCFLTNGKLIWIELNKFMPFPLNHVIVTTIFVDNVRKSFWRITFLELSNIQELAQ